EAGMDRRGVVGVLRGLTVELAEQDEDGGATGLQPALLEVAEPPRRPRQPGAARRVPPSDHGCEVGPGVAGAGGGLHGTIVAVPLAPGTVGDRACGSVPPA